MRIEKIVAKNGYSRADVFVAEALKISRSAAVKIFEEDNVLCSGEAVDKKKRICEGDILEITIQDPQPLAVVAQDIDIDIVYEDDSLIIVNKAKGMVVHPAPGNYDGTLVNALMHHCRGSLSGINGVMRPGIVHRIDKDTSGLLIVAKNDLAHNSLALQIKEHSFTREYETVVIGNLRADKGKIDAPIGRHQTKRKQMAVTDKNAKNAITHYEVVERKNGFCHLRLRLETGRTHQIRVHMAYVGHPVVGDPVYAPQRPDFKLNGQCLHAKKIGFVHPKTGEYLEFDSELPDYFKRFWQTI